MSERIARGTRAVLAIELVVIGALLTVALDQYAHKRVQQLGGVNTWGYRGAVVPTRQPHEFRIAVLGGDQAFGWGVAPEETTTAYLRTVVQTRMPGSGVGRPVRAVNLGAMGLPARGYASRLSQFAYLAPDVVCLYVDLVDTRDGSVMPPHDSGVAALTGYVPMLPLVLDEKGLPLAGVVGRLLTAADRGLYDLVSAARAPEAGEDRLVSIGRAVHVALGLAPVVVVVPVPLTSADRTEHDRLLTVLQSRASATARLRVVDLAAQPRLFDPGLRLDGVSFGAGGQSIVADEIAPAVAAFVPASEEHP